MSEAFTKIVELVTQGDWRASDHGLQRIEENGMIPSDLEKSITTAVVVEDYPEYHAGACVWPCTRIELDLCMLFGASLKGQSGPRCL